jgi:hypothetical protein
MFSSLLLDIHRNTTLKNIYNFIFCCTHAQFFFQSYESPSGHIMIIYHRAFTFWRILLPINMWLS